MTPGIVYLVGAGPGDPGLITVKGARLLRECDAIVYDRLVHPSLLGPQTLSRTKSDLATSPLFHTPTLHYVGKRDGEHHASQDEINALLIRLAQEGKRVVRLKGGDPFIFGRGGEEALALAAAGIPFEIVPGVTAGVAVPAYAGIPVTHRDVSTSVTFVTANTNGDVHWHAIAALRGTIVIFMGAATWPAIKHHFDPHTPAAAIHWGTYPHQRVATGTVVSLDNLESPTTIILGDVVRLRDKLSWFPPSPVLPPPISPRAILLIDHGSRLSEANAMLHDVARLVEQTAAAGAGPPAIVEPAHMELAEPTIAQGFASLVARGAREITAVPYMLSPGRHSTQDIPRLVAQAAANFPNISWRLAPALGVDDRLAHVVLHRAHAAQPPKTAATHHTSRQLNIPELEYVVGQTHDPWA